MLDNEGEKTKVASQKSLSILRLELLTCVLLSKLISEICPPISSRLLIDSRFCCADSEVTLCWIIGKEKSWKPWVRNRVSEVWKVVERCKWSHVGGEENPADYWQQCLEGMILIGGLQVHIFHWETKWSVIVMIQVGNWVLLKSLWIKSLRNALKKYSLKMLVTLRIGSKVFWQTVQMGKTIQNRKMFGILCKNT